MTCRVRRMEERYGTWSELQNQLRAQELRMRTCPLCGKECDTQYNMEYKHKGSNPCIKTQHEQCTGTVWIPPAKRKVVCVCRVSVCAGNLFNHQQTDSHRNRLKPTTKVFCEVCKIPFNGMRPERDFKAHCLKRRHREKVAALNSPPLTSSGASLKIKTV